jgi:hypothetical protein
MRCSPGALRKIGQRSRDADAQMHEPVRPGGDACQALRLRQALRRLALAEVLCLHGHGALITVDMPPSRDATSVPLHSSPDGRLVAGTDGSAMRAEGGGSTLARGVNEDGAG